MISVACRSTGKSRTRRSTTRVTFAMRLVLFVGLKIFSTRTAWEREIGRFRFVWTGIGSRPDMTTTALCKKVFFQNTLPLIALNGLLRKDRDDGGDDVPPGVVWVPYTLNVVKYIYKRKDVLEKSYCICYVGSELLLKEHAMYKATCSISSEDMAILGTKKDDGKSSEWRNVLSVAWGGRSRRFQLRMESMQTDLKDMFRRSTQKTLSW